MKSNDRKPGRRGFLFGMLTGVGAAALVSGVRGGKSEAKEAREKAPEQKPSGPILYRRTPEIEKYYKTLEY